MKKRLFKLAALLLCVVMCASLFGCGKEQVTKVAVDEANFNEPGVLPLVKEKTKLQVGVIKTLNIQDYETNAYTKFLEEKTGVDIDFYYFQAGGMQKLNLMLASNSELPGVIMGFNIPDSTFVEYADYGIFLKLNDYIEKYGYWYKEMVEKSRTENLMNHMKSSDGNIYFMPQYIEQVGNNYGAKAFINKKWLDKLGLQMPKTTEDFRNVMKAFKTKDPNGNGKKDEIGFTGSKDGWNENPVGFLMNSFVYEDYSNKYNVDENHKVTFAFTHDEYRDGLEYVNSLMNEGLVDIQTYTQDNKTLKIIAASEDNVLGAFASGSPDGLFKDNPERLLDYVALPPLEGPKGVAYTVYSASAPKTGGVITKYSENPDLAFKLMDFMLSPEASMFSRYGVEGTDWKKAEEGDVCIFESIGAEPVLHQILPYGATQNSHWGQLNPEFRYYEIANGMAWNGNEFDGEYVKAKALSAYIGKEPENVYVKRLLTHEENKEYNELRSRIQSHTNENLPAFATGRRDLKEWDAFQEELKNLGVERYTELAQLGHDRFRGAK